MYLFYSVYNTLQKGLHYSINYTSVYIVLCVGGVCGLPGAVHQQQRGQGGYRDGDRDRGTQDRAGGNSR